MNPMSSRNRWTLLFLAALLIPSAVAQDEAKTKADAAKQKASAQKTKAERRAEALRRIKAMKESMQKKEAEKPKGKVVALVGGRILAANGKVIESGNVLIQDGKIIGLGPDAKVPDGAEQIDVSGMTVSPGLIDVRSSLWIESGSVNTSGSDGSVDFTKGIDPFAEDWQDVARQGVTTVSVQPGGLVGGRAVALRVAPGADEKEIVISDVSAISAALLSTGNSQTKYSQYTSLKRVLDGAKKYQDEWKKYEEALKKAKEKKAKGGDKKDGKKEEKKDDKKTTPATGTRVIRGPGGRQIRLTPQMIERLRARGIKIPGLSTPATTSKDGTPKKPKKDETKELLVRVLKKEIPLRIEVHSALDAANALQLAKDFKIDVVLEGLSKLGRTWETIHRQRTPLIAGPLIDFEAAPSYRRRSSNWFSDVTAGESMVVIATFSKNQRGSRLLRVHAANAVANGLAPDRALAGITSNAARVLGLGTKTGSLKKGMNADIAVFAGHPLDPAAPVMLTMSQGHVTYKASDKPTPVATKHTEVSGLPPELPDHYVISSSRVMQKDGSFAKATIEVKDGQIVSVGGSVGDDVTHFDLGDAVVTSGLVTGHAPSANSSSTDAVAAVHAADGFDPRAVGIKRLARSGFTGLAYSPGSGSVVAGTSAAVRVGAREPIAWTDAGPKPAAHKFVLASGARNFTRFPSALTGQVDLLNRYFAGEAIDSALYVPESIRAALTTDTERTVAALKSGEAAAIFEAETADEVQAALAIIGQHKLRAALLHPRDFRDSIELMKEHGVGMIIRGTQVTDYDWYLADVVRASQAGIPVAIAGIQADQLRATAALLVNAGMKPEAAMRALTSDAAAMCGLSRCGEIKAEAPADLVVWDGSPIDLCSKPAAVVVDGRVMKEDQ